MKFLGSQIEIDLYELKMIEIQGDDTLILHLNNGGGGGYIVKNYKYASKQERDTEHALLRQEWEKEDESGWQWERTRTVSQVLGGVLEWIFGDIVTNKPRKK
jgi:hypothetical protein